MQEKELPSVMLVGFCFCFLISSTVWELCHVTVYDFVWRNKNNDEAINTNKKWKDKT